MEGLARHQNGLYPHPHASPPAPQPLNGSFHVFLRSTTFTPAARNRSSTTATSSSDRFARAHAGPGSYSPPSLWSLPQGRDRPSLERAMAWARLRRAHALQDVSLPLREGFKRTPRFQPVNPSGAPFWCSSGPLPSPRLRGTGPAPSRDHPPTQTHRAGGTTPRPVCG